MSVNLTVPSQLSSNDITLRGSLSAPMGHDQMDANLTQLRGKINSVINSLTAAQNALTSQEASIEVVSNQGISESDFNAILNRTYPINSVMILYRGESPSTVLNWSSSTWERFGQGRTLMGSNVNPTTNAIEDYNDSNGEDAADAGFNLSLGQSGGSYRHTLTETQIPEHTHGLSHLEKHPRRCSGGCHAIVENDGNSYNSPNATDPTGGGLPHNNVMPYISVYFWRRIA